MKKFLAIIFFSVILTVGITSISGCGCSKNEYEVSSTPYTDLVGIWGERSDDVEVEFNNDGTCTIGGINGTYEIDNENRLTVTPNTEEGSNESAEPLVFEYYNGNGNLSSIPQNQWAISDNKLYINGYQYTKDDTDNTSSNNISANTPSNSSNQASNSSSNSKPSTNSSSSTTPAESKPNGNSNNSSSTTSNPDNSSSNTENPSNSNSNSSGSIQIEHGEEEDIINIYQNLDNF